MMDMVAAQPDTIDDGFAALSAKLIHPEFGARKETGERHLRAFLSRYQVQRHKSTAGVPWVRKRADARFFGRPHGGWGYPLWDHCGLWYRKGRYGACVFTSETYDLDAAGVAAFCDEHGLAFEVSAASWHYPDSTTLIVVYFPEMLTQME